MKTTAWILLFLNIGLLVYFNLDRILPNAPMIQWAEISPEKISLLTEAQISKLPKIIKPAPQAVAAPIVTPPVSACFEWGTFSLAGVSKVKIALEKLSIEPIINEHNAPVSYTHLDVYKRQVGTSAVVIVVPCPT